jgi:hypothetical protein
VDVKRGQTASKEKKKLNITFDKKRLESLSKPKKQFTNPSKQNKSNSPSNLLRNPDFVNNLKFQFRLPKYYTKRENEKFRDTLENIR